MNCKDCNATISNNRQRCETCAKRHKVATNSRRQREKRHERGLVTKHMRGGKSPMVKANCMRCKADILAAENRRNSTLCQSCRDDSNREKSIALWRKRHPKPIMMSGATCSICNRPFVRGLCECQE